MNMSAWASQKAQYSKAKRGRNDRGASLGECALVAATAGAVGMRQGRHSTPSTGAAESMPGAAIVTAA